MSKPSTRPYSRYGRQAVELLGHAIRSARIERKMTIAEVAERAGVSRGLLHRIEGGDMGCSIGATFEVAAIVGVQLFDAEPETLTQHLGQAREKLTLLGLVACLCRSDYSFRLLGVRRPGGFCLPKLNAFGAGYRSR